MARPRTSEPSLLKILHSAPCPLYALDGERRIVYCNAALGAWLGMEAGEVVGAFVEYHSEPIDDHEALRGPRTITGLCPPPSALAGEPAFGTVSTLARDGRLIHRRARFMPLDSSRRSESETARPGVVVFLDHADLSPTELEAGISRDRTGDELHRAIRQFRRQQASEHAIGTMLGDSSAMRRVRAQGEAAAASPANVLVRGRRGSGRARLARAIHYRANPDLKEAIFAVDCELITEEDWRRALEACRGDEPQGKRSRPTLLLLHVDELPPPYQAQLHEALRQRNFAARVIATQLVEDGDRPDDAESQDGLTDDGPRPAAPSDADPKLSSRLIAEIATIVIDLPRLADRPEDLPLLAQWMVEAGNRRREKQVGSIRADALDLLALHRWPGELDELQEVIDSAHRAATSHEITPADLPAVVHHAASAASFPARPAPVPIQLDELLASVEKEMISRALAIAKGNKSEAAELLGMTRPRLYRRLLQLGLASAPPSTPQRDEIVFEPEMPEFEP